MLCKKQTAAGMGTLNDKTGEYGTAKNEESTQSSELKGGHY